MVAKFISNKLKDFVRRKNTTKCVSSIGPSLLKFLPTFKQIILKNQTKNKIKITSLSQPQTNINIYIYTDHLLQSRKKKGKKKRERERDWRYWCWGFGRLWWRFGWTGEDPTASPSPSSPHSQSYSPSPRSPSLPFLSLIPSSPIFPQFFVLVLIWFVTSCKKVSIFSSLIEESYNFDSCSGWKLRAFYTFGGCFSLLA